MKLSIVIVNYNVCFFLEQCLKSVQIAIQNIDSEVFVVDNNSVDGSVAMLKEKFPDVKLIASPKNLGFSKGNNLAIAQATGEYILLLNPDTLVEHDTLIKCCHFMDKHPEAGGLGIYMVDGSGEFLPESKRGLPTPLVAFYKISGLSRLFPQSKKFGKYHLGYLSKDQTHEIDVLSGAFMLMRKETLDKVGLLDEDYFMYGEDIDLSYRITQGGYKNYYLHNAKIIHYKGESTKKTSINYVFIFYKAMIIFAQKHFSKRNASLFRFLISGAIYLKAGIDIFKNFIKGSFKYILDFCFIYGSMYVVSEYWSKTYKAVLEDFPPAFMELVVPIQIVFWSITNHLSGGNDKPAQPLKILRGVLIGTLLISAFTNFFDEYRFSKGLILIGGLVSFTVFFGIRWVEHFLKNKTWKLSKARPKNVAIVGLEKEAIRVQKLLQDMNANVNVIGFVSTESSQNLLSPNHLGDLTKIEEIIQIHRLNELIFCSKDIPANIIIELMIKINSSVSYKIVPADSNYVIGSNNKNATGDLYTIDIKLNISELQHRRNKRLFDMTTSLLYLILFPIHLWFKSSKATSLKNAWLVLLAKKTWIGYHNQYDLNLPNIKQGIIAPSEAKTPINDYKYARDYTVWSDIKIFFMALPKL